MLPSNPGQRKELIELQARLVIEAACVAMGKIENLSDQLVIGLDIKGRWWGQVEYALEGFGVEKPEVCYLNFGFNREKKEPEWGLWLFNHMPYVFESVIAQHLRKVYDKAVKDKKGVILFDNDVASGNTIKRVRWLLEEAIGKDVTPLVMVNFSCRGVNYLSGTDTGWPNGERLNLLEAMDVEFPLKDKKISIWQDGFYIKRRITVPDPSKNQHYLEWQALLRKEVDKQINDREAKPFPKLNRVSHIVQQ